MSSSPVEQDVASSDDEVCDESANFHASSDLPNTPAAEVTLIECIDTLRKKLDLSTVSTNWLHIPEEIMHPKKMCAVNQFVHIVDKIGIEFFSHANELVLVSSCTTVSDHFRWMIQCVNTVRFLYLLC